MRFMRLSTYSYTTSLLKSRSFCDKMHMFVLKSNICKIAFCIIIRICCFLLFILYAG